MKIKKNENSNSKRVSHWKRWTCLSKIADVITIVSLLALAGTIVSLLLTQSQIEEGQKQTKTLQCISKKQQEETKTLLDLSKKQQEETKTLQDLQMFNFSAYMRKLGIIQLNDKNYSDASQTFEELKQLMPEDTTGYHLFCGRANKVEGPARQIELERAYKLRPDLYINDTYDEWIKNAKPIKNEKNRKK